MDPFMKESLPGTGGYVPAPATQPTGKRTRRNFPAWFRSAGRGRYVVAASIVGTGALAVPTLVHSLTPGRSAVLVATHELTAGHVIVPGDLKPATGSGPAASVVLANQSGVLVGHQLRTDVPSGALLSANDVGPYPPAGTTLVPVAVKPGQYPPNLQPGYQVAVFPTTTAVGNSTQAAAHAAATGRVVQVDAAPDTSNGTVVVLLATPVDQAPTIAQAAGVVLVTLDSAGDVP